MILAITEYCAWEQERWTIFIDPLKQSSVVLNQLFIFQRLANKYFEDVKDEAPDNPISRFPFGLGGKMPKIFAASRYNLVFFSSVQQDQGKIIAKHTDGKGTIHFNGDNNGYKGNKIMLYAVISPRKMQGVLNDIRHKTKPNNRIYKNLEYLFVAPKLIGTSKAKLIL